MDSIPMGGMGQISKCTMSIKKETFCLAPWYSIFLDSNGKIAPCCKFKDLHYSYKQIEEYFHSPDLTKVRKDLLGGIKNTNCNRCWKDEEAGGDSLRLITNRTIALHSEINLQEQISNPTTSNIKSFDLTLGNLCNLKCVMCNPSLSSQLLAEANLNPTLQSRYGGSYDQKDFDWPKGDDFVEWCNRYLPQAIHIKFTGGEPFLIPWIHDAIESIPDNQKAKCVLHFTTNLTVVNDKIFESFKKFKAVWISVSVEGTHSTHEYLRYGHSWDTLSKNLKSISEKNIDNLIFKINHVVQTPSYHSILEMTDFFDQLKMKIHPIMLKSPRHYHISALTRESKQHFLDSTEEYTGLNLDFIKFVRSVSQEYIEQNTTLTKECIQDLTHLDLVRKNNHKDIIPEGNIKIN
jgi:sulfatase maturation enzyme AslB (radical SAM superfamily)